MEHKPLISYYFCCFRRPKIGRGRYQDLCTGAVHSAAGEARESYIFCRVFKEIYQTPQKCTESLHTLRNGHVAARNRRARRGRESGWLIGSGPPAAVALGTDRIVPQDHGRRLRGRSRPRPARRSAALAGPIVLRKRRFPACDPSKPRSAPRDLRRRSDCYHLATSPIPGRSAPMPSAAAGLPSALPRNLVLPPSPAAFARAPPQPNLSPWPFNFHANAQKATTPPGSGATTRCIAPPLVGGGREVSRRRRA
jgi:hypothetical protein